MSNAVNLSASKSRFSIHEDWVVVILSFVIITLFVSGLLIPVPAYSWKTTDELVSKVLTAENLFSVGAQFFFKIIIAGICSLLLNKALRHSLLTFLVVYILTVVAMIVAGNGQMKA